MLPKQKYLDKVETRLAQIQDLFPDEQIVREVIHRVQSRRVRKGEILAATGAELDRMATALHLLLHKDLPALLSSIHEQKHSKTSHERPATRVLDEAGGRRVEEASGEVL